MTSNPNLESPAEDTVKSLDKAPVLVRLSQIHKHYKGTTAVEHVDLDIRQGEFFTFLGPSGSGKTTTLRMIAGFEKPDRGHITINGADITRLPPFERDVNTVFQDYALFPHMTVADNVAYGLQAKRVAKRDIPDRVAEALRMVRLDSFADRLPSQLSGGQRQRVALARAIVNHPQVLLLDEPLGALDLKLRQQMQVELQRIQREVGITFIYVTHDQEEALVMSDRIAVFANGRIEQMGTPVELYERPATEFVANFLGTSNVLQRHGKKWLVRPERIRINPTKPVLDMQSYHVESGVLREVEFIGMFTRYIVTLSDGSTLLIHEQNLDGFTVREQVRREESVWVSWSLASAYELPA
ncbi:ABC transporter ATP-binding protein [Mangrovitalea sediminis]|uniref:ABC transporter ATP-binding protein n=1 Tax=Mangrovitalea sediminis TaxID=1982043 RepID=UPI000BE60946|nr:ABC transporter ATP-binding protein [Mangrovitalea sediminis]